MAIATRLHLLFFELKLPYQLRWNYIFNNKDWFIDGLILALQMAFIALLFGSMIGVVCAFGKQSKNRIVSAIVTGYVELIRNVPLLLFVFIFFFGLPQIFPRRTPEREFILTLLPTPERTFIVALAIYSGAYLTEIFASGMLAVSKTNLEAGRSLGLSKVQLARYVTSPIMFRAALPSLSNTFISLFKDTGIAFFIGVRELSFAANKVNTDFFRPIEGWAAAGLLYFITAWLLAISLRWIERQIKWSV